jgi:hypothetical protein
VADVPSGLKSQSTPRINLLCDAIDLAVALCYNLALPDFLKNSGSGTGSTQPREYN